MELESSGQFENNVLNATSLVPHFVPVVARTPLCVCGLPSVTFLFDVFDWLILSRKRKATAWDNNFWLDLDYLQVAQAALNVQLYFTAVLYAEIWCDVQR